MMSRLILFLIFIPLQSNARVFDFDLYKVSTYFKGNYGLTNVGKDAYEDSSGATTVFADEPGFNWGGEIGILMNMGTVGLRLGYELINPQKQSGIKGTDTSGTELLTLDSSIIGAFPVAHVEIYFSNNSKTSRFVISAGGGYGSVDLKNSYSNAPVANYTEKGKATTYMLEVGSAFEFLFVDNVTVMADLGYRYVPKTNFKAQNSFTNVDGGTVTKGDVLLNADGSPRQLDLGGLWIGLGFRFYIKL